MFLLSEVQACMQQTGDRLRTQFATTNFQTSILLLLSGANLETGFLNSLSLSPSSIQLHNNEGGQRRRMQNKCHCRQPYYCQSVYGRGNVQIKTRVAEQLGHCLHFFGSCFSSTTNLASWQQCSENDSTIPSSWKVFTLHFIFLPSPAFGQTYTSLPNKGMPTFK